MHVDQGPRFLHLKSVSRMEPELDQTVLGSGRHRALRILVSGQVAHDRNVALTLWVVAAVGIRLGVHSVDTSFNERQLMSNLPLARAHDKR